MCHSASACYLTSVVKEKFFGKSDKRFEFICVCQTRYSVLARAVYGMPGSASFVFRERSSIGLCGGQRGLRHRGDGLRALEGRGKASLGWEIVTCWCICDIMNMGMSMFRCADSACLSWRETLQ